MTTTQKAFNNTKTEIEELTALRPCTFGYMHGELLNTIKVLETKLAEIAIELTAERYATEY